MSEEPTEPGKEIEALIEKYLGIKPKKKRAHPPELPPPDDSDLFASMTIRYPPGSNPPRPEAKT